MNLKQALRAFLDHRREVLVRRARHRLAKIEARLHILDGLLIAYLNLDEVIRIVREEDEPKAKLIAALRAVGDPGRGDPQHPAAATGAAGGDGAAARARRAGRGA
jgi:DNA gyrase/topoisomerase IV subunit A